MLQRLELGQFAAQGAFEPQYLLFECGGIDCAVPLAELREVRNAIPRTIPLPGSPDWMLGIFPVRSEMLALVDPIPALFGELEQASPARTAQLPAPDLEHASVLIIGTGERSLALVIDRYSGTPTIPSQELDPSAQTLASTGLPIAAHYVIGIFRPADAGRTYMVLHADHLLSDLIAALEEADESNG
jgi:chemotaxis signal transduction protein